MFDGKRITEDRDQLFWTSFEKMRSISEDDEVALDSFSSAARICQKNIKIRCALSHIFQLFKTRVAVKTSPERNKFKLGMKKIEFLLSWVSEDCVPIDDYIFNLNRFEDRIRREMKQFQSDMNAIVFEKDKIAEIREENKSHTLITELPI